MNSQPTIRASILDPTSFDNNKAYEAVRSKCNNPFNNNNQPSNYLPLVKLEVYLYRIPFQSHRVCREAPDVKTPGLPGMQFIIQRSPFARESVVLNLLQMLGRFYVVGEEVR